MKYDFTSVPDRRGRDALALDALGSGGTAPDAPKEGFDAIPMWVADMHIRFTATLSRPARITGPLWTGSGPETAWRVLPGSTSAMKTVCWAVW